MELIDIQPQEFMLMYGITLTNLKKLSIILDNMQFNYNSTLPEHMEAKEYLETGLYPAIQAGLKAAGETNDS